MSLFPISGWAVETAPVREVSHQVSKKRKRPSGHNKMDSAEVNVEKIMAKLSSGRPEGGINDGERKKRQKTQRKNKISAETSAEGKNSQSSLVRIPSSQKPGNTGTSPQASGSKAKKTGTKRNHVNDSSSTSPSKTKTSHSKGQADPSTSLTALQKSMKNSLDGARFRLINENLYKTDSHQAHEMMRNDPKVFEEYHTGFRHQVVSWPINPVEHFAKMFASYPQKTIIADLGCGDAALAKNLLSKGIAVISFDLVSDNEYVVEADVCQRIPLPGSEGSGDPKSSGNGGIADVVVCALSLMGVNWPNCIREAWRILKPGGELHIAEVTSRFTDVEQFQNLLGSIGFRLKSMNDSISSHFILFEFAKAPRVSKTEKEWTKLLSKGDVLKPCEYKRR